MNETYDKVFNSPVNNSHSKQLYSFGRARRFRLDKPPEYIQTDAAAKSFTMWRVASPNARRRLGKATRQYSEATIKSHHLGATPFGVSSRRTQIKSVGIVLEVARSKASSMRKRPKSIQDLVHIHTAALHSWMFHILWDVEQQTQSQSTETYSNDLRSNWGLASTTPLEWVTQGNISTRNSRDRNAVRWGARKDFR